MIFDREKSRRSVGAMGYRQRVALGSFLAEELASYDRLLEALGPAPNPDLQGRPVRRD